MSELQKNILKDTTKRKICPERLAIWFIKGKKAMIFQVDISKKSFWDFAR